MPRVKGNRLVETKRRVDAETSVASYAYLPLTRHLPPGGGRRAATRGLHPPWRAKGLGNNRRAKKVVQNCGTEHLAGDGGNTTVHFYYGGMGGAGILPANWNVVETRNGSDQATAQYVWGTQYTDELVMADINGDASESSDCDPDEQAGESTADERYFYHQDRNWNVVALSEYDTGGSTNGRIVERYSYTPYGQFVVLTGDSGSGELGNLAPTSTVGNPFAHQGLPFDHEKASYQNRHREYAPELHRFAQRDPLAWAADGYVYAASCPTRRQDPSGQRPRQGDHDCCCFLGETQEQLRWTGLPGAIVCREMAERALDAARTCGLPGLAGGQADAFRHCYWSCLTALRVGAGTAKKCTDVHEACGTNPPEDDAMDQHNNALGRGIASTPGANDSTCYNECLNAASAAGPNNCPPAVPDVPAGQAQTCPGGDPPPYGVPNCD